MIAGLCWWLRTENKERKEEIEKVRDYSSNRFHEMNNKTLMVLSDFVPREEMDKKLADQQRRIDQLRDMMNGKH